MPTLFRKSRPGKKKIKVYNVIFFGESGTGKTSILNMLAGREVGTVSSGAKGCTFQSTSYDINIMGTSFRLFDTAGLEEGESGRVPKVEAIIQLHNLIMSLKEGVSLLVFCMRAPRIKDSASKNWRLFNEIICRQNVPIVIAITGLENEPVMDDWWHRPENKGAFDKYEMYPSGFACIVATRGKLCPVQRIYRLQEEYDESKLKMERLIEGHHLTSPWHAEPVEWFKNIVETTYDTKWCWKLMERKENKLVRGEGIEGLIERCQYSEEEARALVRSFMEMKTRK